MPFGLGGPAGLRVYPPLASRSFMGEFTLDLPYFVIFMKIATLQ